MHVAKPLVTDLILQFIGEFILKRNRINVMFVAGAVLKMRTLEFFREFILERKLTNVMSVTKISMHVQL